MNQATENAVTETVDEVADIGADKPATQTVGVDGGATPQEEQTAEERLAAINMSKEEAKKVIDEAGAAGFILIAMQDNGTAKAMMAGDYATVVHAAHTAVCALGSIVKQVQGEHDGNPEKHAKVEDFTAGVSVLTVHHSMLAKMHADKVAEATVEAAASVKQ